MQDKCNTQASHQIQIRHLRFDVIDATWQGNMDIVDAKGRVTTYIQQLHVTLMSRPSTSSPADTSSQPVTRSRTLFYLSIRDSITPTHNRGTIKTGQYGDTLDIADNEEEERLIEGSGGGKGLPPKWYAFVI